MRNIKNSQEFLQTIHQLYQYREQRRENDYKPIQEALKNYLQDGVAVPTGISKYNQDKIDGLRYLIDNFMKYEILPDSKSIEAAAEWILCCVDNNSRIESSLQLYSYLDSQLLLGDISKIRTEEIKDPGITGLPLIGGDAKQLISYCTDVNKYIVQIKNAEFMDKSDPTAQRIIGNANGKLNTPYRPLQLVSSSSSLTGASSSSSSVSPTTSIVSSTSSLGSTSSRSTPLPALPPISRRTSILPPLPPLPQHQQPPSSTVLPQSSSLSRLPIHRASFSTWASSEILSSSSGSSGSVSRLTSQFESLGVAQSPSDLKPNDRRFSVISPPASSVSSSSSLFSSSSSSSSPASGSSFSSSRIASNPRGSIALPGLTGSNLLMTHTASQLKSLRSDSSSVSSSSSLRELKSPDESKSLDQDENVEGLAKTLQCPVSLDIFTNPVILICGANHPVELGTAADLLESGEPCPCCRGTFTEYRLDRNLKNVVEEFLKIHPKYKTDQHQPTEKEKEILQAMKSKSPSHAPLFSSSSLSSSSPASNSSSLFEQKNPAREILLPRLVLVSDSVSVQTLRVFCAARNSSSELTTKFLLGIQAKYDPTDENLPIFVDTFDHKTTITHQKFSISSMAVLDGFNNNLFPLNFRLQDIIFLFDDLMHDQLMQPKYKGYIIKYENNTISLERTYPPYRNLPANVKVKLSDIYSVGNQLLGAVAKLVTPSVQSSPSFLSRLFTS